MSTRQYDLTYSLMQHMRLYGYEIVDLPILEPADLFLVKAGDQIISRLFTFERHGKQWALRPEFTAPAAFHYITTQSPNSIVRWQFNGQIFEDDPNNVRKNQHFSIGAELIGTNTPSSDAEIIALAAHGISAQNIQDWHLIIGHIGLLRQALDCFQLDLRTQSFLLHRLSDLRDTDRGKKFVLDQFDRLQLHGSDSMTEIMLGAVLAGQSTMGTRTIEEIAQRLAQKRQRATQRPQVIAALEFLEHWTGITGAPEDAFPAIDRLLKEVDAPNVQRNVLEDWIQVIKFLKAYGIPSSKINVQPSLARSWEYYTGIVFELHSQGVHLGGGGRYDELARLIGSKQNVPAVGFAYYIDNLLTSLSAPPQSKHQSVLSIVASNHEDAIHWAKQLRNQGIAVQLVSDHPKDGNMLIVEDASSLRWQSKTYQTNTIDNLVTDIKNQS